MKIDLLHLIRQVKSPHCVLCLKTQRKLIEKNSLNNFLACLKDEEVWSWKHAEDKEMKVCYMCEARLVSALKVIELIRTGIMANRLLRSYKKKELVPSKINEHPLRHVMEECNARFKAATAVSNLFLTEALTIDIKDETTAKCTEKQSSAPNLKSKTSSISRNPIQPRNRNSTKKVNNNNNYGPNPCPNTLDLTDGSSEKTPAVTCQDLPLTRVTAGPTPGNTCKVTPKVTAAVPAETNITTYTLPPASKHPTLIKLTETLTLTNSEKYLALKTPGETVVLHAIYQGTDGKSYVPTLSVMIDGGHLLPMPDYGIKKLAVPINNVPNSNIPNLGISLPGLDNILAKNAPVSNANASIQGSAGGIASTQGNTGGNALIQGNTGGNASIQGNAGGNELIQDNAAAKELGWQSQHQAPGSTLAPPNKYNRPKMNKLPSILKSRLETTDNSIGKSGQKPKNNSLRTPFDEKDREVDSKARFNPEPNNRLPHFDASTVLPNVDATSNLDSELSCVLSCFKSEDDLPTEKLIDVFEETVLMEDDPLEQADHFAVPAPVEIKSEPETDSIPEVTNNASALRLQNYFSDIIPLPYKTTQMNRELTNTDKALIRLDILNKYKKPIIPLVRLNVNKTYSKKTFQQRQSAVKKTFKSNQIKKDFTKRVVSKSNESQVVNIASTTAGLITIGPSNRVELNTIKNTQAGPNVYSIEDDELSHLIIDKKPHVKNNNNMTVVLSDTESEEEFKQVEFPIENVVKNPKMKDGYNMDWEDKIPMDVITYMDATDPTLVLTSTLSKREASYPAEQNTDGGGALGIILDAYSERDVVCIDVDD